MRIRQFELEDEENVAPLVAAFREEIARLRGRGAESGPDAARGELAGYLSRSYPVFLAEGDGGIIGYLVCRTEKPVVWAEQLYVRPDYRRRGVGAALYAEAERLAESFGSDTVYNWVDPENDAVIAFLAKRGFDVLNLLEIRRPRRGEEPAGRVRVGGHEFRR